MQNAFSCTVLVREERGSLGCQHSDSRAAHEVGSVAMFMSFDL